MLDIRDTLLTYLGNLTISGIESYKDGVNDDLILQDSEEIAFKRGAVIIGDSRYDVITYVRNNDKVLYYVNLWVGSKRYDTTELENATNILVTYIHNNTLNDSRVISCKVSSVEPIQKPKNETFYNIISLEILTVQNIPEYCPIDVQITYVDYSLSFVGGIAPFVATGTFSPTDVASFTYVIDSVKSGNHTYYSGVVSYDTSTWDIGSTIQLESDYTNTLTVTLTTTYGAVVTDSLAINFST